MAVTMRTLGALAVFALATLVDCQVRVISPSEAVAHFAGTNGMIEGSTATFGTPLFGKVLSGHLVRPDARGQHCNIGNDKYTVEHNLPQGAQQDGEKSIPRPIFVVDRGGCTFVRKVREAEKNGAHAVIIVNNDAKSPAGVKRIIPADDGTGGDIRIPSVLIDQDSGNYLATLASSEAKDVLVELVWTLPPSSIITVDFWFSSGSSEAAKILQGLRLVGHKLRKRIQFRPHYAIFQMDAAHVDETLCLKSGKGVFCAPDPDGDQPVTGKNVVEEDLRQICLRKNSFEEGSYPQYSAIYWDYVATLGQQCPIAPRPETAVDQRFGEACSYSLMASLGANVPNVRQCVAQRVEEYLGKEQERKAWSELAMRINGVRFPGSLDQQSVADAICSTYEERVPECDDLLGGGLNSLLDATSNLGFGSAGSARSGGGISLWAAVGLLLLLLALLSFVFLFFKKYLNRSVRATLREEVMLEVKSAMQDYAPLQG